MKKKLLSLSVASVIMVAAAGCTAPASEGAGAPDVAEDTLGELGTTFTDPASGITITAHTPEYYTPNGGFAYRVTASMTSDGTAGQGVCAVQPTNVTGCDPNGAKGVGGHLACKAALGATAGYSYYCGAVSNAQYVGLPSGPICMVRPGSQTAYCAGTPALPWKTASGAICTPGTSGCFPQQVPAGTYTTPSIAVPSGSYQQWISYACYGNCGPAISDSSPIQYLPPPRCEMCGNVCC